MKFEQTLVIGMLSALPLAMAACDDEAVRDERQLGELSSSELGELCDELEEAWPTPDRRLECGDGSSVTFLQAPGVSCGQADLSLCRATAGDVRACTEAIVDDPCSAAAELPPACAALQQVGCTASTTPGLTTSCPGPAASDIAPFEGIYELVSRSSDDACDPGSLAPLDGGNERFLVIVGVELFGAPIGSLESCTDIEACRAAAARLVELASDPAPQSVDLDEPVPELSRSIACKSESAGALLSRQYVFGSVREGICDFGQVDTTVTRAADGTLRLESRTFDWEEPAEGDACTFRAGEKPATAPCSELEIREARYVSTL